MGELDSSGKRFAITERSPLARAAQFGVRDCAALPVAGDAVYERYCAALVPAVFQHYETVVAAVFDRYFVSAPGCGWPPSPPTSRDRELSTYEDITRYQSLAESGLAMAKTVEEIAADGVTNLILAVEGMDFVHSEAQIDTLLAAGVRVFALQYNRPNALSRGTVSSRTCVRGTA